MRKIRDVLRLKFDAIKRSDEKIAQAVGIGETTVRHYLSRAKAAGLTWPLPEELCDQQLEDLLYPPTQKQRVSEYDLPNFEHICKELKRKGVTLALLWQEYRESHRNHCCYSQFCQLYNNWGSTGDSWMIQAHKAGESTFIDWAGLTVPIHSPVDGSIEFEAQIFVAALGASSYIFARAMKSQKVLDWCVAHKYMNAFYNGISDYWIPDNLKSGVTKPDRYEPHIQETYEAMARHYQVAVVPARVRRPQDKSKAEISVYAVENQVLAPLRDKKFFSLEELNAAMEEPLEMLNKKPFQNMPGSSRYSLYLEIEKPALNSLPDAPYEVLYYGRETLNQGYHIFIEGIAYSVPYKLIGKSIELRGPFKLEVQQVINLTVDAKADNQILMAWVSLPQNKEGF